MSDFEQVGNARLYVLKEGGARHIFPKVEGLRNVSPSQVKKLDECEAKWGFNYIDGIRTPPTPAMAFGTEVHDVLEDWLVNAKLPPHTKAGKVAQQGLHHLPPPGPHLMVESRLGLLMPEVGAQLVMLSDCINPPFLIIDHKTTSNIKAYAETPKTLVEDPQQVSYGAWVREFFDVEEVTAQWVYYEADRETRKPMGSKSVELSTRPDAAVLDRFKAKVQRIVQLRDAAPDVHTLNKNKGACWNYGGCPYKARCNKKAPGKFFTVLGTESKENTMGLKAKMDARRAAAQGTTTEADAGATSPPADPTPETVVIGKATNLKPALAVVPETMVETKSAFLPAAEINPPSVPEASELEARLSASMEKAGLAPLVAAEPEDAVPTKIPAAWEKRLAKGEDHKTKKEAIWRATFAAELPCEPEAPADAESVGLKLKTLSEAEAAEEGFKAGDAIAAKVRGTSQEFAETKPFVVLINALPSKGVEEPVVQLIDVLAPLMRDIADESGKAHWKLIKYGEGAGLLAVALDELWAKEGKPHGTMIVDDSAEAQAVASVLVGYADRVTQGVR